MAVDMDMRECVLIEMEEKIKFDEIEIGKKCRETVTKI